MQTSNYSIIPLITILLIVIFANAGISPVFSEDAIEKVNKTTMQKMYTEYLKSEGYPVELDDDGDVLFKFEGNTYFIQIDPEDTDFFRIVLPNFWPVKDDNERQKVLEAVNYANAESKTSKVFIVRNNVWASIELFVADPEDFKTIFKRSMSALQYGVYNFVMKMKEKK